MNVTSGNATTGAAALVTALHATTTVPTNVSDLVNAANKIVRDMGKTLYLQQNGQNVQIFKYVTVVNNLTGEGAFPVDATNGENDDNGFFVCVWAADGTSFVPLARTGY